jgi:uncharacterized membrane protein YgcG
MPTISCLFLRIFPALICLHVWLSAPSAVSAAPFERESIISFHSRIEVRKDRSLKVTETIKVRCLGDQVKHGLDREFPVEYHNKEGGVFHVGFAMQSVTLDGAPEPYVVQDIANGKMARIGQADVLLPHGEHTFVLVYVADKLLGSPKNLDGLYWDVTGSGWRLPIEQVEAVIELPEGASVHDLNAFTGPAGAKGSDYQSGIDGKGVARVVTTHSLDPGEGLTVFVTWPKGFVNKMGGVEHLERLLLWHRGKVAAWAGFLPALLYLLLVRWRATRQTAGKTIMPVFDPPVGYSPSAMRYLREMGYDAKTLAAAILSMAVKGFLSINREDRTYILTRDKTPEHELPPEEACIGAALFRAATTVRLEQASYPIVRPAIADFSKALADRCDGILFKSNLSRLMPVLLWSMAMLALNVLFIPKYFQEQGAGIMIVFMAVLAFPVVLLGRHAAKMWVTGRKAASGFMLFSVLIFAGIALFLLFATAKLVSPQIVCLILGTALVNACFFFRLKAYTPAGHAAMDAIEGFRLFLSGMVKDRPEIMQPASINSGHYERLLPYAVALDVEKAWSGHFSAELARAGLKYGDLWDDGMPGWYYTQGSGAFGGDSFASDLSCGLASAVFASSSQPGSDGGGSTDSGGGGYSGGGDSGGGGGGW